MKRAAAIFCIVISCALLMGAAGSSAPVLPSESFYVNDYAGFLDDGRRDFIFETAGGVFENTGAQIVVLTVESLGGQTPEEYARDVFNGWEIGGRSETGLLILVPREGGTCILVGQGLHEVLGDDGVSRINGEKLNRNFVKGEYAQGITEGFKDIVAAVYAGYGIEATFEEDSGQKTKDFGAYAICALMAILIVRRAFTTGPRYRRRRAGQNTKGYEYKRNTYTRERLPDEDDYPSGFGGAVKVTVRQPEDEDIDWSIPKDRDGETDKR